MKDYKTQWRQRTPEGKVPAFRKPENVQMREDANDARIAELVALSEERTLTPDEDGELFNLREDNAALAEISFNAYNDLITECFPEYADRVIEFWYRSLRKRHMLSGGSRRNL